MDKEIENEQARPDQSNGISGGRFGRISNKEWDRIEKFVPHNVREVGKLFSTCAQELVNDSRIAIRKPEWNQTYWHILTGVVDAAKADQMHAPRAKGKAKKEDEIRARNITKSLLEDREVAMKQAKEGCPGWTKFGGRSEAGRVESYVFGLMLWAKRKRVNNVDRIVSIQRCISFLQSKISSVPDSVVAELRQVALDNTCGVSEFVKLLAENESFLSEPSFKIPGNMALYPEQKECVKIVLDSMEQDTTILVKYQTPPSGGKTSVAALLSAYVQHHRKSRDAFVIYTCYSDFVRIDVCKHLVAASVPFAIVHKGIAQLSASCYDHGRPGETQLPQDAVKDPFRYSMKIIRNAGLGRKPCVLICDVQSTELILSNRQNDVFIFDEPTANVKADTSKSVEMIIQSLPRRTVFMSATMHDGSAWDAAVRSVTQRHSMPYFFDVCPKHERTSALMSVTALDLDGRVWGPHHFGQSPESIEADFHLYRFYSPRVLDSFLQHDAKNCEHITIEGILSYEGVRVACMNILRNGTVPAPPIQTWPHVIKEEQFMLTKNAHRFTGTTLVFSKGADDFYNTSMLPLLADAAELPTGARVEESDLKKLLKKPWPKDAVVNSQDHADRYGATLSSHCLRASPPLPSEIVETSATGLAASALCGVLLMGSRSQDNFFALTAQHLAEENHAAFVCSGHEMIYGVNLPINRVYVNLELTSFAEMKQLCGRAARTGRASQGEIVFCTKELLSLAMCGHNFYKSPAVGCMPSLVDAEVDMSIEVEISCTNACPTTNVFEESGSKSKGVEIATMDPPRHARSHRQSPASKAYHNLTKKAVKWFMQMEKGELSQEQLEQNILESRVAEGLREKHGNAFVATEFLEKVLRNASKS